LVFLEKKQVKSTTRITIKYKYASL